MSLLQKAAGAVLRLMPEKPDDLIGSKRAVGQPISRVDGPLKVAGKARFAAEVPFENLAYAALVYSRIARGTIAAIETGDAEAAPGVLLVMTYKNAPRLKRAPWRKPAPTWASGRAGLAGARPSGPYPQRPAHRAIRDDPGTQGWIAQQHLAQRIARIG